MFVHGVDVSAEVDDLPRTAFPEWLLLRILLRKSVVL